MRKILLFDTNALFRSDIQGRLMIGGYDDLDIETSGEYGSVEEMLEKVKPDEVVLSEKTAEALPSLSFDIPAAVYARNREEQKRSESLPVSSYGLVLSASDLLDKISSGPAKDYVPVIPEGVAEEGDTIQVERIEGSKKTGREARDGSLKRHKLKEGNKDADISCRRESNPGYPAWKEKEADTEEEKTMSYPEIGIKREAGLRSEEGQGEESELKRREASTDAAPGISIRDRVIQRKKEEELRFLAEQKGASSRAEDLFRKDAGYVKERAKVIAVTSAKGGVGKTTIACELATYLSCTSGGKENFKVCLVDGNVAFGGVLSTLDFSAELANMSHWTTDIKKQMIGCKDPSLIRYTEKQIAFFLQQQRDSGLFALLAPITHDDSVFIEPVHFSVMLNNLIENGGFDYVICDTGSNADDHTVIALEKADAVLLVLTQNVNTANCNRAFLETMAGIGFDMDVFRIVLNQVKSGRAVGLEAQELAEHVTNPVNGEKFPCLAQIRDLDEVRNCGNLGEPAVFHSGSDFTKSIGEIAAALIGHEFVLEVPEKKGWLARALGRK